MIPTAEWSIKLANLFHRRLTTHWGEREVAQYRKLVKSGFFECRDDWELLEQYYAFERKRGDNGRHRRDLYTFLNNAHSELDRAREWRELHPVKSPPRKIIPMPPVESNLPVEHADPAQLARFEEERRVRRQQKGFLL